MYPIPFGRLCVLFEGGGIFYFASIVFTTRVISVDDTTVPHVNIGMVEPRNDVERHIFSFEDSVCHIESERIQTVP